MQPIEIACVYSGKPNGITLFVCGAQAGELCRDPNGKSRTSFHAERVADAASISSHDGTTPTVEQFNKALEGIDIV